MINLPILYGRQEITDADIQSVVNVLKSNYLTQGPEIEKFEKAFSDYVGSKYAVSVSNGTAALHLCTLALSVSSGDKVITTPLTFAASANCVKYSGGEVIFTDIDPETYLIDLDLVEQTLEQDQNNEIKGVIAVDFGGRAVDLEKLRSIADKFGIWIIEDACHAPGGFFIDSIGNKQNCGNGSFADLAIFSFHPVKHITCGEGGMITTNNFDLYCKLKKLRSHGISRDPETFTNSLGFACHLDNANLVADYYSVPFDDSDGEKANDYDNSGYPSWYMEMQDLGYNYRLTDIQATLGLSQLSRASRKLIRRHEIAKKYDAHFENKPYILQKSQIHEGNALHLYIIEIEDRLGLYKFLRMNKVYVQIHYFPLHLMPFYQKLGWKLGDFPVTEDYYRKCLTLPLHPSLTDEEVEYVLDLVDKYYRTS
jgi:UDP-4-amino-4,6-dideoxy-N-acetyl-beta-L-altrosamine transaminase